MHPNWTSNADRTCAQLMTQQRVDETYIKVKGVWKYLYRAVDSEGNTLEFMLSAKRDARAAERFFRKALKAEHNCLTKYRYIRTTLLRMSKEKSLLLPTSLAIRKLFGGTTSQKMRFQPFDHAPSVIAAASKRG